MRSPTTIAILSSAVAGYLRFVNKTSPAKLKPDNFYGEGFEYMPVILALWHGQHFMGTFGIRPDDKLAVLVSRSKDGELNAQIIEKLGAKTIRGSGGRRKDSHAQKGGTTALLQMITALENGCNVAMTADIPKGTPRKCGMGVITLAKLSGRPILPIAYASSRRKVFEKAWDKAVMNLPFGNSVFFRGVPIEVPRDADDEQMEAIRLQVEEKLNQITEVAYAHVDGKSYEEPNE